MAKAIGRGCAGRRGGVVSRLLALLQRFKAQPAAHPFAVDPVWAEADRQERAARLRHARTTQHWTVKYDRIHRALRGGL